MRGLQHAIRLKQVVWCWLGHVPAQEHPACIVGIGGKHLHVPWDLQSLHAGVVVSTRDRHVRWFTKCKTTKRDSARDAQGSTGWQVGWSRMRCRGDGDQQQAPAPWMLPWYHLSAREITSMKRSRETLC
jgi:hypothetical protein